MGNSSGGGSDESPHGDADQHGKCLFGLGNNDLPTDLDVENGGGAIGTSVERFGTAEQGMRHQQHQQQKQQVPMISVEDYDEFEASRQTGGQFGENGKVSRAQAFHCFFEAILFPNIIKRPRPTSLHIIHEESAGTESGKSPGTSDLERRSSSSAAEARRRQSIIDDLWGRCQQSPPRATSDQQQHGTRISPSLSLGAEKVAPMVRPMRRKSIAVDGVNSLGETALPSSSSEKTKREAS